MSVVKVSFSFWITVPLPCIVSEWTNWSEPDATGTRFRFRMMLRPALNGGKECEDLMQTGKGKTAFIVSATHGEVCESFY